ncbi:DNA-binding NarL/FixJ family response regulator [Polymorphobacter multimanifer]|uniref:DNA-binding NarL/FixJ family response regulator n=1 Tax=Polymorphobacter multimanifer TaxID=1070431 RepID=A0A841LIK4_9SPHN|nr:alpha/beta fold hydrolase [Polymorphobacter multimanifer]MBB6228798.1 DNA-binding NarL/FixJ family response regulator [Polymorphobacter multimanifer]
MKSRAAAFLEHFRSARRNDAILDLLVDDYDGLYAAIQAAPEDLLAAADDAIVARGPPANLHADSFASAACDGAGNVIVADARFHAWLGGPDPLAAVVGSIGQDRISASSIACDHNGRPVALAAARLAAAQHWPLAENVRAALCAGTAGFAVIAFRPADDVWAKAAQAFGLSRQESRLTAALARCGDLKEASAATGVAYGTARKLVASAMRKVGAERQTDLVRRILGVAAGDLRAPQDSTRLFADLFGLSMRQAALAQAVASGATRDAAAMAVGTSSESAKADLRIVFQSCGVASAVDLARIAAEIDALAGLAAACSVEFEPRGEAARAEPLRLIARRRGIGSIAVTDCGPAKAQPLLMMHPAVGGRHQSRHLVAALQAAGWRPISFDRPGFGLTTMVNGACPFAEAALDAIDIVDALGIDRITLFGRTASAATLAVAAAMPARIAGGILVAPDPPAHLDRRHVGMMGRGKALFLGNRTLATAFANILSRRTSSAQIARMQRQSVAGSAVDEAVLDDPEKLADIIRASRQAALGMWGFLAEMQAQGGGHVLPVIDGRRWIVMAGAGDPLYDFEDSANSWRSTVPGAQIEIVADGGRWLHLSHVDRVVSALDRIASA